MRIRKPVSRAALCWMSALVLAISAPAHPAPSDASVPVRIANGTGFGRLLFEFPSRVRFQLRRSGNRVTIEFADANDIGAVDTLPRNVAAVTSGMGRAEIAVAAGAEVRPGRIGNQIYIDVLDPVSRARQPAAAPPSRSIPDTPGPSREKAGESGALLASPESAAAASSRLIPDGLEPTRRKAGESGGSLTSPESAAAANAPSPEPLTPRDAAASDQASAPEPKREPERSEPEPAVAAAPTPAVTIPPPATVAAPPTPAIAVPPPPATGSAPSSTPAVVPPPASAVAAAPAPAPAAPALSAPPGAPVLAKLGGSVALIARLVPGGGPGWAFVVPFDASVGAAAFRRGNEAIFVFDERRPIDLGLLRGEAALAGASVQILPAATMIRLPLPPAAEISLERQPTGWVLHSGASDPPLRPIRAEVSNGQLRFAADAPGQIVTVIDPASGTVLLVGTQRQPGQGVPAGRHAPEFEIVPTWQGVVLQPLSDQLALSVVKEGFALTAGAVALALTPSQGAADALAVTGPLTRRFDFTALPTGELMTRLQAQKAAASAAPPLARGRPRHDAAQTMIALGLGVETQALLQLASAEDPRQAQDADTQALLAIASLLAGRTEDAGALADPRLNGTDEIGFWRVVRAAQQQEGSPEAASVFAATAPLLRTYPGPLRARLLLLVAETLAVGGETAAAEKLLAEYPEEPTLALARAMLLEAKHDTDGALAAYDALAAGRDRLTRARAAFRAVELRLAAGRIDARQAADALDALLYAWRGDQRDLAVRLRLAALRAQTGAWRASLTLLREAQTLFPEQESLIRARLQETFAALIEDGNADKLPPLDLIALVEDNADLLPTGAGEGLASRIADRLMALDLPQRAAPVFEKLMDTAQPGPVRAGFGARLAALRLRAGDAAGAVTALSRSAADGLPPALVEQRTLTEAAAKVRLGDTAGAIAMLSELGTPGADEARAPILEGAKDWPAARRALADLVSKTVPSEGALDDAQRRALLRLATAAAQAGDEPALAALRRRDTARMGAGPLGDMFRVLTADPVRGVADLRRAGREIALARGVTTELQSPRPAVNASP